MPPPASKYLRSQIGIKTHNGFQTFSSRILCIQGGEGEFFKTSNKRLVLMGSLMNSLAQSLQHFPVGRVPYFICFGSLISPVLFWRSQEKCVYFPL